MPRGIAKNPAEKARKISLAQTGRKHSSETIEKRVSKYRGVPRHAYSKEFREKISKAHKGKPSPNKGKINWFKHTDDWKKAASERTGGDKHRFFGKHHSEETRLKISNSTKGKKRSEEHRRKMSETSKKFGLKPPVIRG